MSDVTQRVDEKPSAKNANDAPIQVAALKPKKKHEIEKTIPKSTKNGDSKNGTQKQNSKAPNQ